MSKMFVVKLSRGIRLRQSALYGDILCFLGNTNTFAKYAAQLRSNMVFDDRET